MSSAFFDEYLENELIEGADFPEKDKSRAKRRKKDVSKALRKRNIVLNRGSRDWYGSLHQYSKNKIHCSCPMCRFKSIFEPDQQTHSDMMRVEKQKDQMREYYVNNPA